MCEHAEKCIDRPTLLVILVPFLIGGICFSIVGETFLSTLPTKIVSIYDRIFVVFVAFLDMGSAFAVGSFTLFVLLKKLVYAVRNFRAKRATLNTES